MVSFFLKGWNKIAIISFGCFVIVMVLLYAINLERFHDESEEKFTYFYNSSIAGKITCDPYAGSSGTYFCVEGKRFNFLPYSNIHNDNNIFSRFANVGDSIYKEAKSDTLILIKGNNVYEYTFWKNN
ncbi:MAG: hypothetical protein ACQETL_09685 [Bacteroidota bacterium]